MQSNATLLLVILIAFGFLIGSIPFGKLAGVLRRVDIQKQGSGNIGFANAFRVLGWQWAIPVLVGDLLKGYLPLAYALQHLPLHQALTVGLATFLGSIFSPWLGWTGGKGVATLLGASLAFDSRISVIAMAVYLIVVVRFRTSSLASLAAVLLLFLLSVVFQPNATWFYVISLGLILVLHRANIQRLIHGEETSLYDTKRHRS